MDQIKAPFSAEQVVKLNEFQSNSIYHPFTCCSEGSKSNCQRRNETGEGMLIASTDGWICPCGEYKQGWAYKFMTE